MTGGELVQMVSSCGRLSIKGSLWPTTMLMRTLLFTKKTTEDSTVTGDKRTGRGNRKNKTKTLMSRHTPTDKATYSFLRETQGGAVNNTLTSTMKFIQDNTAQNSPSQTGPSGSEQYNSPLSVIKWFIIYNYKLWNFRPSWLPHPDQSCFYSGLWWKIKMVIIYVCRGLSLWSVHGMTATSLLSWPVTHNQQDLTSDVGKI